MAVCVKTRKGKCVTLLNPSEKGTKFADELRNNVHLTNDGLLKMDRNNKPQRLTREQKAFRSGYLAAQKDGHKAYKSKHPNYKRKTRNFK